MSSLREITDSLPEIAAAALCIAIVWWKRWTREPVDTVPPHLETCPTCRCDREPVEVGR